MIKIVKEHIGFHYLLKEIQLYTLSFFGIEYIPQEELNKISRDDFVSVNNVLRKYYEIKTEIKNPETSVEYII